MGERKKEQTFVSRHRTGLALLKIVHKVDSAVIPLRIIQTVLDVAGSYLGLYLTARFIDSLLEGRFREGMILGGLTAGLGVITAVAGAFVVRAYGGSSKRCEVAFEVMMREKAVSLDYETMEQPQVAEQIYNSERTASMYGGLESVVDSYHGILAGLLNMAAALGLVAALCMRRPSVQEGVLALAAQPWVSALTIVLFACILSVIHVRINSQSMKNTKAYLQDHTGMELRLSYLLDRVAGSFNAAKVVRIYDMKDMLMGNITKYNQQSKEFYGGMCDMTRTKNFVSGRANSFFVVCSYLFVAVKVLAGAVSVGSFTQYVGALTKLSGGFGQYSWFNDRLSQIITYMGDFLELMGRENCHAGGSIPVEKRLDGEYEIEFKDVSFHYPGSQDMILEHVNCRLDMKNKLALVGKNGAGKTTFVKLLCRLYEPTDGVITLNGIDIRRYREEEYRELFGVVFQDFKLFSFPLWQNLAAGYARDEKKIWENLEKAGAGEFVKGLPQGIDTLLFKDKEGGVDVSGGEAQKLALARALYKDAPFVVLDEPTAALDPISEAQVYESFHEMVRDKTSIYISHRMSSCRFCDDIVVFDDGKIVERGSHEELLAAGGCYAGMWNAQAKYYTEDCAGE